MKNFTYYTPTKVVFGKGVEEQVGTELYGRGFRRVLLHYGGGSIKKSGLYDTIIQKLTQAGIAVVELSGVMPNPRVSLCREGVALCREQQIDCILAVGGGSVIDSAKSIALATANDCDPWDITTGKVVPLERLPIAVVLTIAAAGSEMSESCVITNEAEGLKRGFKSPLVRPDVAFLNPELTYSVSPYQTACGVVDILMHTLERYLTPDTDNELCDRMSEGLMVAVKNAGLRVLQDPGDYEARSTLLWASSLSHNDLTGTGKTMLFTCHKLGHEIGGMFDVAHGATLSVVFPAYAKYVYHRDIRKFAQLAVRVLGVEMDFENPQRTALQGIATLQGYFEVLGMPTTLPAIGVPPDAIEKMADKATSGDTVKVPSYTPLGKQELMEIYKLAL